MKSSRFDLSTHPTTERCGYLCLWTLHVNLPVHIRSPSLCRKPPKSSLSKHKGVILVPIRTEIWFKEREWSLKETSSQPPEISPSHNERRCLNEIRFSQSGTEEIYLLIFQSSSPTWNKSPTWKQTAQKPMQTLHSSALVFCSVCHFKYWTACHPRLHSRNRWKGRGKIPKDGGKVWEKRFEIKLLLFRKRHLVRLRPNWMDESDCNSVRCRGRWLHASDRVCQQPRSLSHGPLH